MRLLLSRVLLVGTASLSIASVAWADKPAKDSKPAPPGQATETTDARATDEAAATDPAAKAEKDKVEKAEKEKAEKDKAEKEKPVNHGQDVSDAARDAEPGNPEHTVMGESVGAAPVEGKVLVRLPGSDEITALPEGAPLPVGTVVDASEALVQIAAEAPDGTEQQAVVTGGVFRVDQSSANGGVTDLVLQHGAFEGCGSPGVTTARAAAARKQGKGEVVRGLWAAGKGRFRTHGRGATATVRGTQWATVDRCNSTTVKVFDGVVDVQDKATGKVTAVRAGERIVVKRQG